MYNIRKVIHVQGSRGIGKIQWEEGSEDEEVGREREEKNRLKYTNLFMCIKNLSSSFHKCLHKLKISIIASYPQWILNL